MSIEGSWNVKMDTPMGTQQFTLSFSQSAGAWNGTLINERTGNSELSGLKVDGDTVSFDTKVNSPMGSLKVTMNATVQGDAITGVCKTMLGNANFAGQRA
jgi:hypothetical protein